MPVCEQVCLCVWAGPSGVGAAQGPQVASLRSCLTSRSFCLLQDYVSPCEYLVCACSATSLAHHTDGHVRGLMEDSGAGHRIQAGGGAAGLGSQDFAERPPGPRLSPHWSG